MASTMAFTLSPFFSTSEGCLTRLVQLRLLTWTSPSIPSSISMKAPKSVKLRTLPSTTAPTGNFSCRLSQGFDSSCFRPRLLRIDVQHHGLDLVVDVDQLGGMLHALGPGHLADVYQPFDALFQFDERAVVGHADNAAVRS